MSIIRAEDLGQDYEDKPPKDGSYVLAVRDAKYKETKKGDRHGIFLMLVVDGPEGEGLSPINHTLMIPNDDEEPQTRKLFMRNMVRFLKTFGWTNSDGTLKDFDPEGNAVDLVGLKATCNVKNEESKEDHEMYPRLKLPKAA